jgi:chaperonin GroEL
LVYRPKVDEKLCFVLMPFGFPFDSYYQRIIKPAAVEAGLAALRSDEIHSTNSIVNDIWRHLWAARVVVADVSNRNPNVNYELGLCDALGIPTIIITGKIEDVPFDYKHKRCILYDRQEAGCDEKLHNDLVKTIGIVLAEGANEDELRWPYETSVLGEASTGGVALASADSRKIVIRGANLVRNAIASTFGPRGTSVAVSRAFASTAQTQRGVEIARSLKSLNPLEEKGMEQVRAAASSMYDAAGDGTKLVIILAAGFMTKGQELVEAGFHPRDVVERLDHAVKKVLTHLSQSTEPVTEADLISVATTAASGDSRVGLIVVEGVKRAGKDGIVTIETSDQVETTLEVVEGTVFDRGYLSDYFVTDPKTLDCVLEECRILVHQRSIHSMKDLLPLLEQVAKSQESLLVVAEDVDGEALATLTLNHIKGTIRCAAVRSPGHADRRKALMEDLAVLTGARFLSDELGLPLNGTKLEHLGKAKKVIITKHDTTIIGGAGSDAALQGRIRSLQTQMANTASTFDREKLQERVARLAGSLAVLKAGGLSEADIAQERYHLESAMFSVRSAIEHGTVVGGGIALLRAGMVLKREVPREDLDGRVAIAVATVLEEAASQLVENAQESPTMILSELQQAEPEVGFDARERVIKNLRRAGILDPAKPIELALKLAASYAASVLQTGAWDLSQPLANS